MTNTINIDTFCTCSGISFADRGSLIKTYGSLIKKEYSDWYSILSVDYAVPKNLSKVFSKIKKNEQVKKSVTSKKQTSSVKSKK